MEIKIGSRWKATGRNLPSEEIKVKMFSTCPSALTGLRYVTTECGRDYNEKFFLNNFTPIEGQTVFKLNDRVKHRVFGLGTVNVDNLEGAYPLGVDFDNGEKHSFSKAGFIYGKNKCVLEKIEEQTVSFNPKDKVYVKLGGVVKE